MKSALSTLPNIYVDLVVILLDIKGKDCLVNVCYRLVGYNYTTGNKLQLFVLQVEINLLGLEPALLCGRTVLVNPKSDMKRKDMGVSYDNIDKLKKKYDLLILHGNIEVG